MNDRKWIYIFIYVGLFYRWDQKAIGCVKILLIRNPWNVSGIYIEKFKSEIMRIYIPLFILMFCLTSFSQKPVRDVVYLNNGSIIKGNIIEISENKSLKIESCENILVFDLSEVLKIVKEEYIPSQPGIKPRRPGGYSNITSFGMLTGPSGNSKMAPLSIETVNAYRFNYKYSFGLGIGMDLYEKVHVPVFIDCRYDLLNRNVSPVIILKAGYSFPAGDEVNNDYYYYNEYYSRGGPMMTAGTGFAFRINDHNQLIISLSYRYQQLITTEIQRYNESKWKYDHSVKYNRLEIKFGFYFD